MQLPTDYVVPAYLISGAITAVSLMKIGIWLKTSVNGRSPRSSQSDADAEFRGEQRKVSEQHTELFRLMLEEQRDVREVLTTHTGLLKQLVTKLK